MTETIGIFGGTFDPPHLGHLILAAESLNQLQLDRVLWVLASHPPHKPENPITPLPHRIEMLKRTINGITGFEFSTIEIDRPSPHYTLDTIDLLQSKSPRTHYMLLIGGDSLATLPSWHRSEELVTAVYAVGVMRRPGDKIDLAKIEKTLPLLKNKLHFFATPQLEISSSSIRQRIAAGGHFRFYLPPGVYDYIQQNKLYR